MSTDEGEKALAEMTIDELIVSVLLASSIVRHFHPASIQAKGARHRIDQIREEAQKRDSHPLTVFVSDKDLALPPASDVSKTGRARRGRRSRKASS